MIKNVVVNILTETMKNDSYRIAKNLLARFECDSIEISKKSFKQNKWVPLRKTFEKIKTSTEKVFNKAKKNTPQSNEKRLALPQFSESSLKQIELISRKIEEKSKQEIDLLREDVKKLIPQNAKHNLTERVKAANSSHPKLKTRTVKEKSSYHKDSKGVSAEMKKRFNHFDADSKYEEIEAFERAEKILDDRSGFRDVPIDVLPESIDELVEHMSKALMRDDMKTEITEIRIFKGKRGLRNLLTKGKVRCSYFDKKHVKMLQDAAASKKKSIVVIEEDLDKAIEKGKIDVDNKVVESKYISVQFKLKHESGALGELQIRGPRVDKWAEVEHIPFDLSNGKDITGGIKELESVYKPVKNARKNLNKRQVRKYKNYRSSLYKYHYYSELGYERRKPKLSSGIPEILSEDVLYKVKAEAERVKTKLKEKDNL